MSLDKPRVQHCYSPHCHSALYHYEMFHLNNSSSSYGNNSVFEYNYNFNGGNICGGGFWGGFWGGIGIGIGNFLGNLLGGIMPFGGGYGGFMSFGGYGGGYSPFGIQANSTLFNPQNFWNIGNKSKDGESGKEKVKTKTVEVVKENKDKLKVYDDKLKSLEQDKNITPEKIQNLYNEIKNAYDKRDDINEDGDKSHFERLLIDLRKLAQNNGLEEKNGKLVEKPQGNIDVQDPDGAKVEELTEEQKAEKAKQAQIEADDKNFGAKAWTDAHNKDFKNVTVYTSDKLKGYTNGNGEAVTKNNLKGVFDNYDNVAPTPVKNGVVDISKTKYENDKTKTNFPLYLKIKDDSNNVHKYKCIGVTSDGFGVYRTPDSDNNHNQYILAYDAQAEKYVLTQEGLGNVAESWGKGKSDTQPDANKEEDN